MRTLNRWLWLKVRYVMLAANEQGLVDGSRAGRRGSAIPGQLFDLLTEHQRAHEQEREHAGTEWREGDWMFAQPDGKPIDPRRDYSEWKTLLKEAGVREARVHDARHSAATTLLLPSVSPGRMVPPSAPVTSSRLGQWTDGAVGDDAVGEPD